MNILTKSGIIIGSLAGAGGISYGIYNTVNSSEITKKVPTYSNKFHGTLLNTSNDTNKANWISRLASLKQEKTDTKLTEELKTIRDKDQGNNVWKELRDWCKDIINTTSKEEANKEYQNIQNYCTFSIEEKVGNVIKAIEDDSDVSKWENAHSKLKTMEVTQLDETLRTAKTNSDATASKKEIKKWCVGNYSKPYKGDKDQVFINAKLLCLNSV